MILSDPDDIRELFTADPERIHPGRGRGSSSRWLGATRSSGSTSAPSSSSAAGENPLAVVPQIKRLARWSRWQRRFEAKLAETDEQIYASIDARRAEGAVQGQDIL